MIEDLEELEVNHQEVLLTDNHQEVLVTGNHHEVLVTGNHQKIQVTGISNHQIHQPMKIPNIHLNNNRDINRNLSAIDGHLQIGCRIVFDHQRNL